MKFPLGTGPQGPLLCDLDRLVDTRLLVQANSGGGKSWLLRRLLEQTHGRVQHLVIDPEGEFASLREKYDYVLAAPRGGDTLAEPRSAALLAERLLELRVSAVLDIYELKHHDRIRFVRLFLDALVNAPKKLWHPALVVVDEVHVYCPEKGEAESASAVIDLATRGRKRGFCAVLASQRLAKVSKDAAAECNNVMIGRTGLDVDVKRAADVLGFAKDRWRELRELAPGQFFTFGPALAPAVVAVQVGPVETTHPKAGARLAFTAPQPTETIRALLPKLADLPAEAAERQRTAEDLRREVQRLKAELARAPHAAPPPPAPPAPLLGRRDLEEAKKLLFRAELLLEKGQRLAQDVAPLAPALTETCRTLTDLVTRVVAPRGPEPPGPGPRPPLPIPQTADYRPASGDLTETCQRIVDTLLMLEVRGIVASRETVARWMGIHPNGGRYGTDLGWLRREGYLANLTLTPRGRAAARALETGPAAALAALPDDTKRRLLETIMVANGRAPYTRETLAAELGIHPNGGRYGTDLGWLRTMGLIPERGPIAPMEALFR